MAALSLFSLFLSLFSFLPLNIVHAHAAPQTPEHYRNLCALLYLLTVPRGWRFSTVFVDTACRVALLNIC